MPKVTDQYIDDRRQQIINAAYRCFARNGIHQTTMREICAEAELSPGAIYNYFKSKDDIVEASFIFDYQRSIPVFERALDDPDPVAAIEHLLDFFFAGIESAAALGADRVNIQGWGEALFNPKLMTALRGTFTALQGLIGDLIQRGQKDGRIDASVDSSAAPQILFSAYLGLYLQKAMIPDLDVGRYKSAFVALLRGNFASSHLFEPVPVPERNPEDDRRTPSDQHQ